MVPGVTIGLDRLEWGFTGKLKYKVRNISPLTDQIYIIRHI